MLKLAVTVVAIALPDCINPSLIGGELFVATGPKPRRAAAAFTFAAWAVTLLVGLALALGLGDLILSFVPTPSTRVKYALITAAGVVLVLGGTFIWIRRTAVTSARTRGEEPGEHGSAALIGAGLAGLEVLTAFPYFAAIALIVGSGVSNAGKLSLLLLYCVIYTLPLIVIVAVITLMGDHSDRLLRPVEDWLFAHWPLVVGPLTVALGAGVVAFGVAQLISV